LTDVIIISTIKKNNLYFAVGVSSTTNKIVRISLPKSDEKKAISAISYHYPDFTISDKYKDVAWKISEIYEGKEVNIDLEMLDLRVDKSNRPVKSNFMKNVLLETCKIPYGKTKTYKSIAEKLDSQAYRAVGTALAKNPFPLVIPCHRIVKSDNSIGKYGGGSEMKKRILKKEGVKIKVNKIVKK
jgi:methylated-DNA-[protein]-cysteine S-methyltransferase